MKSNLSDVYVIILIEKNGYHRNHTHSVTQGENSSSVNYKRKMAPDKPRKSQKGQKTKRYET